MTLGEEGFLSEDMEIVRNENYNQHKVLFDYCFRLNKFANKSKFEDKLNINDTQHIVCGLLYVKILRGFQTAILLYRFGLNTEAKIISRTIIEALFVLKASADKRENAEDFVKTDIVKRLNYSKYIYDSKNSTFKDMNIDITLEEIEQIQKEVDEEGAKHISSKLWAERAELLDFYAVVYKILCSNVHADIKNLQEEYLEIKNGEIVSIKYEPSIAGIIETINAISHVLIIAIHCMCKLTSIDYEKELEKYEEEIDKISKTA